LNHPDDARPRPPDPKVIREKLVDALREVIISGRLKPGARVSRLSAAARRGDAAATFARAVEFHDLLVGACGHRKVVQLHENLKAHQRLLRTHRLRFYENVAPLLPVASAGPVLAGG
jgi:DNA-binding GntR family transcriptional regulator